MAKDINKAIPKIIAKLDAAREALAELVHLQDDFDQSLRCDCRVKLQTDLREFTDYLENATWWRKGGNRG